MLINLSSIPTSSWNAFQIKTSLDEFESISDLELPKIEPNQSEFEIKYLAEPLITKCVKLFSNADKNNAVLVIGDPIFTFYFVKSILERGFRCISPAFDESKTYTAANKEFIRYREYRLKY